MPKRKLDQVSKDGRDQLLGYLLHQRDNQSTTREWVQTWLDAHCPDSISKGLDTRTLRAVARRLRSRANELDRKEKRNKVLIGEKPNHFRTGRAMECDMWADNLLSEARALERKHTKPKGGRDG